MDYLLNCFYIEKATEEHTSTVLCPPLFTFCLKKKKQIKIKTKQTNAKTNTKHTKNKQTKKQQPKTKHNKIIPCYAQSTLKYSIIF